MRCHAWLFVFVGALGCAREIPEIASASGLPGTDRPRAHPVDVAWTESDASGVVVVGENAVCRVPCRVWLRSNEEAFVEEEEPRRARIALPHIPGLDTYDEPPKILVKPARGHPGAALGLGIPGAVLTILWGTAAYTFCREAYDAKASHKDDAGAGFACGVSELAALGSAIMLAAGIVIGSNGAWPSTAIAPRKTPAFRMTPNGFAFAF